MYSRHSVGVVLDLRRRRFVGIEPAMGCDASPTLNRNWVGRPTSCVGLQDIGQHDSLESIDWMLASTGDGGGKNKH